MEKEVPAEIMKQLGNWRRQALILRTFNIILGLIAIVTSVTVASRLFDPNSLIMTLIAWLTAITTGTVVFLGLETKSNNLRTAWRILNLAVIRYQSEENFKVEELNAAYKIGEQIIGDIRVLLPRERSTL